MENKHYIYFHINPVKQEIFNVGKGNGKRYYSKQSRNRFWHNIVNKYGFTAHIIEDNLTAEQANEKEMFYIKQIGRRNLDLGTLVNMTDGGDGRNGMTHKEKKFLSKLKKGVPLSEEHKKNCSKGKIGNKNRKGIPHTKDTKEKVSKTMSLKYKGENNPFYGKKHSEETKKKMKEDRVGKYGKWNKGKKCSKETKKKIGLKSSQRRHSEASKKNIREGVLKYLKQKTKWIRKKKPYLYMN